MIVGAYKAMSIEALEVETFILPLDLYIERLAARIAARIYIIKVVKEIKLIYN
jgi:hypothetical protein